MIILLGFSSTMKTVMLKTVVRYVALNPFHVNDDVIFRFTFYKHRRKEISAVILKPNVEVTSLARYNDEKFLSFDSSDREYIYYLRRNLRFFVRKKVL